MELNVGINFSPWSLWMLLAGVLVIAELLTGTFYLLITAISLFAGGVIALLGRSPMIQFLVAAIVALVMVSLLRKRNIGQPVSTEKNDNMNLDIGQMLYIDKWYKIEKTKGVFASARVRYRGALWDVALSSDDPAVAKAGRFTVKAVTGSCLIVEPL